MKSDKKKSATKKTKKLKDELSLELDGVINVVETRNGVTTRNPLDGKLCLKALVKVLSDSIQSKNLDKLIISKGQSVK